MTARNFYTALLALSLVCLAACAGAAPTLAPPTTASTPARPPTTATASPLAALAKTLTVFAAASLTDAFKTIGKNFEAANPGVTVAFNFAGSQQLAQQIAQGAPADLFASANNAQMAAVIKSGQVVSGTQRTFARNRLVVIYPAPNTAGLTRLQDLAKPGVKIVLADKSVPVGGYTLDFLAKASQQPDFSATYSPTVLANVVSYEQDVKSVLGKVALDEADAGIVYTTDIIGDATSKVGRLDIPDNLNTVASYPIAAIQGSANDSLAQQFTDFVLAPASQAVLAQYGFIAPPGQ